MGDYLLVISHPRLIETKLKGIKNTPHNTHKGSEK